MKFTNKNRMPLMKLGYFLLSFLLFSILIYDYIILSTSLSNLKEFLLLTFVVSAVFFYWYTKAKYIKYDSTGLGLVFISKGVFFSKFINYREKRIEIPKTKLNRHRIENGFFNKKLYLYIISSNKIKRLSFDVTFLNQKKIKYLQKSLEKITQENSSNNE